MSHTLVTLINAQETEAAVAAVASESDPSCQPIGLGLIERAGGVLGGIRPDAAVMLAVLGGLFLVLLLTINNLKMRVRMLERMIMM